VTLFLVFIAEALHHFPGLEGLNATTFRTVQLVPLLAGAVLYPVVTLAAARRAVRRFDRLDL
jgi:hypothetical protein